MSEARRGRKCIKLGLNRLLELREYTRLMWPESDVIKLDLRSNAHFIGTDLQRTGI